MPKPYVASHLKDMNRKMVYQLVSSVNEISRAEISRQTGISSPTVLKIVSFLLDNGFVIEAGDSEMHAGGQLGRKPHMLKFNPEARLSLGVEFEGDFLKLGIIDLLGNIKAYKRVHIPHNFTELLNNILEPEINDLIISSCIPKDKVLGVGLGIPGVLDPENLVIEFGPLVGVLSRLDCKVMVDALSDKLKLPVFIENDANAAALGEFVTRKLNSDSDLVYLSLGTGLGAGIILNGAIRRGKRNSAGEIGYMVFDKEFQSSKSRAGWLESRINFNALSERWDIASILESEKRKEQFLNSRDYFLLIEHVATSMALSIVNLSALIDINLVVVGGITAELLGSPLVEGIKENLSRLSIQEIDCQFKQSLQPGIVGAASIVTERMLNELLVD